MGELKNPFVLATRKDFPLRMALHGPSKSGKTYTSLCLGCLLAPKRSSRVAVVDSENGRSRQYSGAAAVCEGGEGVKLDFDVLPLSRFEIDNYLRAMKAAADNGYKILVVDGLSQAWEQLLETIEGLTATKFKGNSFRAWGEGTPIYRRLMQAILDYPGDVICTMRSKVSYEIETCNGKAVPKKLGLQPVMRDSAEYEFDHILAMDDGCGTLDSRTASLAGKGKKVYQRPGKQCLADILGE